MTDVTENELSHSPWEWEVQAYLLQCEATYRALGGDTERRRYATLALGGLFERLERIPALNDLLHHRAFRDILDFFEDLHRGRDHSWRSLGPFGGLQKYTTTEERIRVYALAGVEILIEAAGAKRGAKKSSFERIAEVAKASGHDLSAARVKGLYYELQAGRYPHPELVRMFISNFWMGKAAVGEVALCNHGYPVHTCAESKGGRCSDICRVAELYLPGLFMNV